MKYHSHTAQENYLLGRLPAFVRERLQTVWGTIPLKSGDVIYEARSLVEFSYFPTSGTLSALVVMSSGDMIEVATVGNDGAVGLPTSSSMNSPHRVVAQVPGEAIRIETRALEREAAKDPDVRLLLEAYRSAFLFQVSQSVACNGLHSVQQRCCRWLLMTHDRVAGDDISLTHEFLSYMIGVRRATVSDVLKVLEVAGLIEMKRGLISIADRAGMERATCECYRDVREEYQRLLQ